MSEINRYLITTNTQSMDSGMFIIVKIVLKSSSLSTCQIISSRILPFRVLFLNLVFNYSCVEDGEYVTGW